MNQNYEQLNTATADSFSNPFTRSRKGGYSEIIRGKNRLGKYILIFGIGLHFPRIKIISAFHSEAGEQQPQRSALSNQRTGTRLKAAVQSAQCGESKFIKAEHRPFKLNSRL